jgi:hypothetical protein
VPGSTEGGEVAAGMLNRDSFNAVIGEDKHNRSGKGCLP